MTADIRTGQRVRITQLTDVIATDDAALNRLFATAQPGQPIPVPKQVVARAGTVYEGYVTDVGTDGFFDVTFDDREDACFYEGDPAISITILSDPGTPDDE